MFEQHNLSRSKRSLGTLNKEYEFVSKSKCNLDIFNGGGGNSGGSTQSTATSYNTNIPEYAQPYVTSMLNATQQQLFNVQNGQVQGFAPYVPYSAKPSDYVAGFSPMQQQAFGAAANLQTPKQFGVGSTMASQAGQGALGTAAQATGFGELGSRYGAVGARIGEGGLDYGQMGARYGQAGAAAGQAGMGTAAGALGYGALGYGAGQTGQTIGLGALGYGQAGANIGNQATQAAQQGFGAQSGYERMATSPEAMQAYMNPYVAASLAPQLKLMDQQLAQQQAANQAQAVGQGAYGGSRQAVQQGLMQQNADLAKQQLIAQGYNEAYKQAQQAQQFGAGLGIQGLQAGTGALQAGLAGQQVGLQGIQGALAGTAQGMQGAQVGLAGIQGAQAGYGLGIQGAQAGMQGAQTGIQGINAALAGTAQGMQGAQIGLQGVQGAQAGYGLANQAAGTLGQLGTQQLAAQQGIIGLQNQLGAQQQQRQQQIINQAVQDYANAQQYPLMQLGTMSNMLRGLPLQSSTTQQYIAQPNATTQAISTLGTAGSLYKAMGSKKGGILKAKKMAKGGITSYDVGGAVEADLYDMPIERLQKELQSPSGEIRKKAKRIMLEKQVEGKAGGGIIAFAGGTPDPEIIPQETATDTQYQAPAPQAPAPVGPGRRDSAAAGIMKADPRALVMQTAQQALTAGDRSLEDIYAELQKGRAPDTARQEYRSKIMEERANARDEDSRQNWLRAAQFFASWGSLPGNTLAAGMQALKGILPDVMSDQKEQKKYMREIDKTLYSLDEAARLEQNGLWDKAAELKQKLGEEKFKILGPLSTMYSADVHAAASRAAAGRETDMKFLYNTKLKELTGGDPAKATPEQQAQAAAWASNQSKGLPEQKLDYKRVADVQKEIGDSERSGTISNLEKSRRLALVQAGTADEKKAVNEDYDRRIAEAKQEITNRIMQGGQQAAAPQQPAPVSAPAAQAPAPLPLPTSQDQLKAGQVYNTSRGPAKWDGKQFVAS